MASYIGAIDQGTTSSRFIVFDRSGRIVSTAQKEHEQIYPRPGWVEHDPEEILRRTQDVIQEAMETRGLGPEDLAAIGITNQRETTVIWHKKSGKPVCNAIVWQDTRVGPAVATFALRGGHDRYRAPTGLPLATYFSGLKIRWILEEIAGAPAQAEAGDLMFGNIDTFLIWQLTGGPEGGLHVTDVTNASRTQLMNLATLQWDEGLLEELKIPRAVLPRIVASSEVYGAITTPALKGTSVAGILGDQQAALVGQACFRPGEAKNTYGTGCFLLMNTGEKPIASTAGLITTVAYQIAKEKACYALEGSIAVTGALVQWLRDNLGLISTSAEVEKLAGEVQDNGGVYFVPAFSGLYAPHWNERARGTIIGLTRYVTRAHIGRAVLEATAYQTREVVGAMEQDSSIRIPELRVDGGMVGNELLMQFQADILDVPVVRPKITETTALGAAYAAGLAVGYWRNREDLVSNWAVDKRWTPQMAANRRAALFGSWQRAVGRSLDWIE